MLQKLPDLDFTSLQHLHHHQNTPTYYFGCHFSICLWVQIAQAVNYLSQPDQYRVAEIHVPVWYKLVNGDVQKAICTDTFTKCQFTFLKPFRYSSIANIAFEVLSSEDFKFRYFEFTLQKKTQFTLLRAKILSDTFTLTINLHIMSPVRTWPPWVRWLACQTCTVSHKSLTNVGAVRSVSARYLWISTRFCSIFSHRNAVEKFMRLVKKASVKSKS